MQKPNLKTSLNTSNVAYAEMNSNGAIHTKDFDPSPLQGTAISTSAGPQQEPLYSHDRPKEEEEGDEAHGL